MVPRTKCFPDGEVFVEVGEAVRGCEVFIVQPTSPPVNEHLVDLLGRYPHRSAGHLRCDSRPIAAGRRRGLTRRRTGEDGGSIRSAPEHVGCRHSQDRETGLAVHALRVVADVRDRPCLIVDMISTGGTIASSINALLDAPGARSEIFVAATDQFKTDQ